MNRLAIIGAGDLGVQLANLALVTGQFQLVGFFDDTRVTNELVADRPVLGTIGEIEEFHSLGRFDCLVVAIGYKHLRARQAIYKSFAGRIPFATLIHPSAVIDPSCTIGEGTVVYPGCVLDMAVIIGENVLLNAGCVIAHHSAVETGCFFSPAVSVAGFVTIEKGCVLGIGTIVIDNIRVTSGVRTGAGAVVTRDLATRGLYLGIPAHLAKNVAIP